MPPTTTPAAPTTRITNPKRTITAVAAAGGTLVLLAYTKFCRYVEIQECAPTGTTFTGGNYAPQGCVYYLPDDGYVKGYPLLPGAILALGDQTWHRDYGFGVPPMNDAAGNPILGTPLCKIVSATATTTQVEQREFT